MKRINWFHIAGILLGGLLLLLIIGPLLSIFLNTSMQNLFVTAGEAEVRDSITRTLGISFAATLVCAIAGIPFAWLIARKSFPGKKIITLIIDLPIVIPHSAAGIAILGFISRDTWVGKIAEAAGIDFIGHPAGIAFAMAFVSVPFLINAARDGFASVPERLEKTALNLGASPFRVFMTISLPLAWRNIVSGLVLMFGRGMSEFGAVVIVAYHPMITPVLIYERFVTFGLKYAQPVSVLFIIICLLVFAMIRLLSQKQEIQR
ncbi:MAG: ABC transporter permease [Bacteroidetes bacterium]|nr:ABC transporter permease [Bacteroidota bacterium]